MSFELAFKSRGAEEGKLHETFNASFEAGTVAENRQCDY